MDAHTLNAWTRFALQKGGIGSCTALVDNPATDFEDLMFMTGEKIIVLRRLDEHGNDVGNGTSSSGSANRRSGSVNDDDSWFLGYCEGVVGRFKGSHVQIHGKLKKPVLMRRSGVGSIRESTTRPMSKLEAASMHVSQVPLGIPISAVDSDGEEDDNSNVTKDRDITPPPTTTTTKTMTNNSPLKNQRSNRLGVNTPPLSDESHQRRQRKASRDSDSDSDDSDTRLPWARSSLSSTKSSRVASTDYTHETNNTHSGNSTTATNNKNINLHREINQSHLPPSPISSAESPINARSNQIPAPAENRSGLTRDVFTSQQQQQQSSPPIPRIRAPGTGHTSNQSSIATTATSTSESEEDSQRRDQTFSIYDVYGRDSVAFPNFNFRNLNGKAGKLNSTKSSDSLSAKSNNSPLIQSTAVLRGMPANFTIAEEAAQFKKPIPPALGSPSGRRPTAAPALVPMATNLRRKMEANAAASPITSSIGSPEISSPNTEGSNHSSHFGSFDPRRRPSLGTILVGHPILSDLDSSRQIPLPDASTVPRSPVSPNSLGSNLLARRTQEASLANKSNPIPANLRVDTSLNDNQRGDASTDSARSSNRLLMNQISPNRPMHNNEVMNPNSPTYRPIRSSSDDRTSSLLNNGRITSGQLKKNPSNPQPGPHGGMTGLIAPNPAFANNGGLTTPTGLSRSPSPLLYPSPSSRGSQNVSPVGGNRMATSPVGTSAPGLVNKLPGPRVSSNAGSFSALCGVNLASVQFDALGFVMGSNLSLPMPAEDAEEVKQWRQVLSENDPMGARKSRKIKKMANNGIPHSLRKEVWPYLANSSVRRRAGFFEELCKTSLSAKGKKGKEIYYDAIDKDLDRAYPDHRLFMGENSTGRADLEAILKAYVHYNPIIGYTQGMSLVAGFLLIQMPAEEAFWLLCALLRDVHMEGYYANTMKQLHVDGVVFGQLLQSMDPELAARLLELQVEPIHFTPNWFLPLFTRVVPWQTLLRIWDIFLYEGPSFILRAALGIIRIIRDPLMDRRICPEGGEALRLLLHPPQHLLTPTNVIPCALSVKLKDGEMRKLSRHASKVVRTSFNTQGRSLSSTAGTAPNAAR